MPRWSSFALLAATALLAAPVGSHYLAQDQLPAEARRANTTAAAVAVAAKAAATADKSESGKLLASERDALEQARVDLAGVVCGFASQHVDEASHGCAQEALADAEIMLAIVPDPVHTQMALRFDRGVDTIENELGQLGWLYDRSWLPWETAGRKPADRWQDRRTDDHLQRAIETLPGVLLFRGKKEGERRPLILLLVGDAPTGGVNAEQFSKAIELWRKPCELVHQTCADAPRTNLAIFGPTFTGSMPSLHRLLHENLPASLCAGGRSLSVSISSGSVSDSQSLEEVPALPCSSIALHQESFAVDAGYLAQHLHEYSSALIANLSERETSFGGRDVFRAEDTHDTERLVQYVAYRGTLDCTVSKVICAEIDNSIHRLQGRIAAQQQRVTASGATVTNLTFPRGISRLRHAYEKNGIIGFTQSGDSPKTQLQLSSAADDDRNDDAIPSFAGSMTTLSMETEMASLAKTLATEHYAAVLLSASDVMDEIFVARYLSQHAPDVTVVVNDADEFFLREGQDQSLQNIYTISAWPLMERNVFWTSAHPTDVHVFPSKSDQGTAAAVQHLVCTTILRRGAGPICAPGSFREYRPPFLVSGATNDNKLEPPLWLSVVGHGGFMPVAMLDLDDISKQLPELSELSLPRVQNVATDPQTGIEVSAPFSVARIAEHTNLALKLIGTLIFVLLLWHGFACIRCRVDRPFAWTYARAERKQDILRLLVRATLSLLGMLALALLYIPNQQTLPSGSSFSVESDAFHRCLIVGELFAALVSSLAVWTAVQIRTRAQRRGPVLTPPTNFLQEIIYVARTLLAYPHALAVASIYFGGLVLLLALSRWNFWWLFTPWTSHPSERIFFLYRASLPLSGASPILPLLLIAAAVAVWAHGVFSQLAFFGHRIPRLPDGFEGIRCPSDRSVNGLNKLLSNSFDVSHLTYFAGCMLAAALMMSLADKFGVRSFSHGPFDFWITVATLLVSATILQDLVVASRAWQKLRHSCLIPLRQSPLRWGFTWVKGFSWKRIWTSSKNLSSNQVFDYLVRVLETNDRDPSDDDLRTCYGKVVLHYACDPKDDEWLEGFTSGIEALHGQVKLSAEARLGKLRESWKDDAGPLTGTDEMRGVHLLQRLDDVKDAPSAGTPGSTLSSARKALLQRMGSEEFVALLYVGYISAVLVQIRHRIVRAAIMYILLMWALTSYPWMYRHTILLELSGLLIALSATTLSIYSQMHRDEILSRTTETEAGKLDRGFFEKVIPVICVPLLTLVASQFPEFSNLIFSWIQPSLSHMQ